MTPAEENALVSMARPLGATNASRDAIRLAIRAAYDKGRAEGTANERKRAAHICDRWSGVGDVVARAIAAAIRRGE